jgi:hypothetical protein
MMRKAYTGSPEKSQNRWQIWAKKTHEARIAPPAKGPDLFGCFMGEIEGARFGGLGWMAWAEKEG